MSAIKEEVNSLLKRLPADASIEDVQYHLYVIDKVQKGLEAVERDGGLTQEQVEASLSKWLISYFDPAAPSRILNLPRHTSPKIRKHTLRLLFEPFFKNVGSWQNFR